MLIEYSMKRTLMTIVVLCCLGCSSAFASLNDEKHVVTVKYAIRSLGSEIGTVRAKTIGTARNNDFYAETNVNAHFWFMGFTLTSSESASIRNGQLVSYHKSIDTKGHHKEISGKLDRDVFKMVVRDGGKEEHRDIPAAAYTVTNMDYPEVNLVPGEIHKMTIADLENTGVVVREYRKVVEENTVINERAIRVIAADFFDKNSEGRRWTAVVGGLPIVLRQEGKEKTGLFNPSYKVEQTGITVDP